MSSAEAELSIVQAALAGHLGLPLDTSMTDLLTALQGNPRPKPLEPVTEFFYVGPMPEGYEFYVVHKADSAHPEKAPVPDKMRGQRMDEKWKGPWRQPNQGALVVADTWKHVTKAKDAEVDEAGPG